MEALNILEDILSKSKGYEIALFTTYNFEIQFFERSILNRLENNNIKTISLFVDSKKMTEAINVVTSSYIGKKYIVTEIETNTSFHPKLILLLGEKKARLIVTSANLTFTGYCYNNEIFNVFDYSEEDTKYLNLIKCAFDYFNILNKKYNTLDCLIFDQINNYNYLHKSSENKNVRLIHNYDNSILEQLLNIINNVKQIDIAVPFYDNELNALKSIKNYFPDASINLYIQNKLSTFNFKLNQEKNIISKSNILVFNEFNNIGTPAMYHGKVFRFITEKESYILYGSANCTESALLKSSIKGGNYECDILALGDKKAFDYFFENFIEISKDEEITNRLIRYNDNNVYNFKYIPKIDSEKLHIKYKNRWDNLEIKINDIKYQYEYKDNEIIITITDKVPYGLFNIDFIGENNNRERIKGYLVLRNVIEEFRKSNSKDLSIILEKINNSKSSEYIKYYKMLLNLIPYDLETLKEIKNNNNIYQDALYQKESDDDYDSKFIVDFDIPDEILNKQKEYNKVESIKRGIISNFILKIKIIEKNGKKALFKKIKNNKEHFMSLSVPISEETKFVRYIKRLFKNTLDIKYLNEINLSQYVDNILILLNVVYTYNDENLSSTFNINEFSNLLLEFFDNIKSGDFKKLDKEIIYILNVILFNTLLQLMINKSDDQNSTKNEILCRNVLLSYDKIFDLRNSYTEYLIPAINLTKINISEEEGKSIIEELFNYKSEEDLYNLIREKINGTIEIKKNKDILTVDVHTMEINKYMTTERIIAIFREVKKRYRQTGEVEQFFINIVNENIDINYPNPIEIVQYIYNIKSSIVKRRFKNKKDLEFRETISEKI